MFFAMGMTNFNQNSSLYFVQFYYSFLLIDIYSDCSYAYEEKKSDEAVAACSQGCTIQQQVEHEKVPGTYYVYQYQ